MHRPDYLTLCEVQVYGMAEATHAPAVSLPHNTPGEVYVPGKPAYLRGIRGRWVPSRCGPSRCGPSRCGLLTIHAYL